MSEHEVKRGEVRFDSYGPFRCMAVADGYAMVRRPRAMPVVLTVKDWLKLPTEPPPDGALRPRVSTIYGVET